MSITRPTPAQSAPQPAPAQTAPLPMREWKTGQRVFRADYSPGHGSLTIQQGIVRAAGPRRVTVEYVVGKSRSEERLEVEFSPRGWATTEDAAVQWLKESLRKEEERLTEQLDKLHTFQRTYLGRPQRLQDILGALADAEAKAVWAVLGEVLEDDEEAAEYVEAAKDRLALLKPVLERLTEVIAALAQPPSVPPPDQGAAATTRYQARSRAMKHLLNEQDVETVGGEVHLGSIFKEDWSAAERYGRALGLEGRPGGWIYLGAERLFQGWVKLATFLQQKKIVVSDQGGFVLRPPLRVGDRVVLKAPYRGYTAGYLSEIPPGGEVVSVALDGYRDTLWVDLPMTNLRSWRPATVAERAAALAALVAGPDAPLRITTARGIPFTVSVEEGKRPLMVFFDMRNTEKFGPKGQKVAEYYADTLAQSRDGVGLALRLGNLDWTIDGPALAPVLALARTLNPAR